MHIGYLLLHLWSFELSCWPRRRGQRPVFIGRCLCRGHTASKNHASSEECVLTCSNFSFLIQVPILELLVNMHAKAGDEARVNILIGLLQQPALNVHNPPAIRQAHINTMEQRFLQRLAGELLDWMGWLIVSIHTTGCISTLAVSSSGLCVPPVVYITSHVYLENASSIDIELGGLTRLFLGSGCWWGWMLYICKCQTFLSVEDHRCAHAIRQSSCVKHFTLNVYLSGSISEPSPCIFTVLCVLRQVVFESLMASDLSNGRPRGKVVTYFGNLLLSLS